MKIFAKLGARFDTLNHRGESLLSLLCKSDDTGSILSDDDEEEQRLIDEDDLESH